MPAKPCPSCRAENRDIAVFCRACGVRIEKAALGPAAGSKAPAGGTWWASKQAAAISVGGVGLLCVLALAWWLEGRREEPARRAVDLAGVPGKPARRLEPPRRPEPARESPAAKRQARACMRERDRGYARHYGEGEREFSAGRYLTARDAFKRALDACADAEAREGVSLAEGKLYEDYMKGGARYEGEREWDGAVASYQNALGYKPGDRGASAGVERARSRAASAGPSRGTVSGRGGIEWVSIPGGSFMMGSNDGSPDEKPVHRVTVKSFQMAKTEVTRAQYLACVQAGVCRVPNCEWPPTSATKDHPVVCVDWNDARTFSGWAGGRLPSEAEWEYAARSGGLDIKYPWGDEKATCARAVMEDGGNSCGRNSTWPVCSKTGGNTRQGLCDMAGNVWEWTQDWYHSSYNGAPSDGSAWERPAGSYRVGRGGSWDSVAGILRAAARNDGDPGNRRVNRGFRPVR